MKKTQQSAPSMCPIRKRGFSLLEVMIALSLLTLCLTPLLKTHLGLKKWESSQVEKLRFENRAPHLFSSVQEALFAGDYSWDTLKEGIELQADKVIITLAMQEEVVSKPSLGRERMVVEAMLQHPLGYNKKRYYTIEKKSA